METDKGLTTAVDVELEEAGTVPEQRDDGDVVAMDECGEPLDPNDEAAPNLKALSGMK